MKALRKIRPERGLEFVDVDVPVPSSTHEVLVRVTATGICGSDLHVDNWTSSYSFIAASLPITLGHEFVGVACSGQWNGRRVVVRPSVTCGHCAACVAGNHDACDRRTGIGMTRNGAFAPWVCVPLRNCVPVPDTVPDHLAALAEPLSISMQALRIAGEVRGKTVLVMGPGTIGQGIAVLARRAGAARVAISGQHDDARLDVLRRMGFECVFDVAKTPLADAVVQWAGQDAVDLVFEATGVPETITEAMPLMRRNGVVVVTGIHARPLSIDLTFLVRRQIQLRGSFRPPESNWPQALELLGELADVITPMVSHVLPLARALEGIALAHAKHASKVLLCPQPADG